MPNVKKLPLLLALIAAPAAAQLAAPPEPRFTVQGFTVEGENPLDTPTTQGLLAPYVGEHVGLGGLQAAAEALEGAIRTRGFAFHRVTVPPQESVGVIRLQVIAFRIGAVRVSGNQHFSEENVRASLPSLAPEATPNSRELGRDLALANEHPGKQLNLVLKESDKPDHIDANIEVKDIAPLQFFGLINNTGTHETGWWRASAGVQHSNLFGRDHSATLSYTTSPQHWGDVHQYGLSYRIPFYGWGGALSALASRSNVSSGNIQDVSQVTGRGRVLGISWGQHLYPIGPYSHRLSIALEDKLLDNDSDVSVPGFAPVTTFQQVRSRPLSLRYEGKREAVDGVGAFHLEYASNLSSGAHNDDIDYQLYGGRPDLSRRWARLNGGADLAWNLPAQWLFSGRARVQHSVDTLIKPEQFGIGGATSVRGFEERELSGDRGMQLNIEFLSPPLVDTLRAAFFYDTGSVTLLSPEAAQSGTNSIASTGAGLRWRYADSTNVTLDAAYVIRGSPRIPGVPTTHDGDAKLHVLLFHRF